jgi:hypothetical protein
VPGGQRQKQKKRDQQQHKPQKQVYVAASRWRQNNANGLHGWAFPLKGNRPPFDGKPIKRRGKSQSNFYYPRLQGGFRAKQGGGNHRHYQELCALFTRMQGRRSLMVAST